jgi:phosphatidylinositol glycan class B
MIAAAKDYESLGAISNTAEPPPTIAKPTEDTRRGLFAARQETLALAGVLAVALAVRLWAVLTQTYILYPDETYQYFEPAHRLAFGYGIVTWEYLDGIRSWLFPGAIAGLMRIAAVFSGQPQTYVMLVRLVSIALSLAVPYVGFRLADRHFGCGPAVAVGLLCAFWYELIYYAPVAMTEEPAAHLALLALWLGEPFADRPELPSRRLALAGALFGLAVCLRYQYGPALAAAALWQHVGDRRRLLLVGGAGLAVVAAGSGLLDALTLGAPFQSIWLNFQRNAVDGMSGAMGVEPWFYLAAYFLVAWGAFFPLFVVLAVVGATRAPAFAVAVVMTIALHSLTPHKEVRFIYLAIATAPILIGLGCARLLTLPMLRRHPVTAAATGILVMLLPVADAMAARAHVLPAEAWRIDRSTTRAFLAANTTPNVCGVGVSEFWVYRTGGYTYLHRDVPMYFETFERAQHVDGLDNRLAISVVRGGEDVPQYPDADFAAASRRFNLLIAPENGALPGFSRMGCYGKDTLGHAEICLFRRPGGCL